MQNEKEEKLPKMLTIEQASRETNICSSTIRKMCWNNKIRTIKTGRKWLINKESLIDYLNSGGSID